MSRTSSADHRSTSSSQPPRHREPSPLRAGSSSSYGAASSSRAPYRTDSYRPRRADSRSPPPPSSSGRHISTSGERKEPSGSSRSLHTDSHDQTRTASRSLRWDITKDRAAPSSRPPSSTAPSSSSSRRTSPPRPSAGPRSSHASPPPPAYFEPPPSSSRAGPSAVLDAVPRDARPSSCGGARSPSASLPTNASLRPPSGHRAASLGSAIPTGPRRAVPYTQPGYAHPSNGSSHAGPSSRPHDRPQPRPPYSELPRRPQPTLPHRPPPPALDNRRPPPAAPIPPDFYKPLGTRDSRVLYDPTLDPSPVKKGKEVIYRFEGEGVEGVPADPRKATDQAATDQKKKSRSLLVRELGVMTYEWDKNSTGPPPPPLPSSILVTGYPGSTTPDQIHRHFSIYGRIESLENKTDAQTGGSLGICRIRFADDAPRNPEAERPVREKFERDRRKGTAQDGHVVALEAVAKGNGSKIGARMMMLAGGVKVEMDGDGKLCRAAIAAEMARRHPPPPTGAPPPPPPLESAERRPSINPLPSSRLSSGTPSSSRPSPFPNDPSPTTLYSSPRPLPMAPPGANSRFPLPPPPPMVDPAHAVAMGPYLMRQYEATSVMLQQRNDAPPSGLRSMRPPGLSLPPRPNVAAPPPPLPASPFPRPPPPGPAAAPRPGRPLPTDPYQPIVFSGPPAHLVSRVNLASKPGYRGPLAGKPSQMQISIAEAVLAAKRRLEVSGVQKSKEPKVREVDGEEDMELDSEDESKASSSDESEVEKFDDQVFFHRDGRMERRKVLMRGQAPAAAIAWQASPQILREKLAENGYPYVSISKASFLKNRTNGKNPPVLNGGELEYHFGKYDLDRTFADSSGWYLTFTNPSAAALAFADLNQQRFAGAPLELSLSDPPSNSPAAPPAFSAEVRAQLERAAALGKAAAAYAPRPKKTSGWTDAELVDEARDIVIRDLVDAFRNDVKNRLVSNKIIEHVLAWERDGSKSAVPVKAEGVDGSTNAADTLKSLSSLPSFARRRPQQQRAPLQSSRLSSEAPSDSRGTPIDLSDPELSYEASAKSKASSMARRDSLSNRKARVVQSDSEDDKIIIKRLEPKKSKVQVSYTSSEAEDDSDGDATPLIVTPVVPSGEPSAEHALRDAMNVVEDPTAPVAKVEAPKKKRAPKRKPKVQRPLTPIQRPSAEDDFMLVDEPAVGIPTLAPTDTTVSTTKREASNVDSEREGESEDAKSKVEIVRGRKLAEESPHPRSRSLTPDPFDRGIAADEEDLFYVKLAIERARMGAPLHPSPRASDDEDQPPPRHPSGSARTEGYYAITVAEKMANRPSSNKAKAAIETSAGGASGVAVSRLARANTRGLVRGMELHKKITATDTDVLKFNQLRTRKKQLTFSRSGIEGYGLFAMELIPAGEMVIEYVGELVRQQVADRREKAYERQGIGSSYLFRVDEDLVVDATKKGNLGRLINHCCAPNCTARIITINGEKKIVIYAKTNIGPGDEVTYDYHFPHEEVKIPCLCAHPLCRKFLN